MAMDDIRDMIAAQRGVPARRALASAGYTRLDQLTDVSESSLRKLHGMGPKAITALRDALAARGLAFKA